jgi:hypothetical protein
VGESVVSVDLESRALVFPDKTESDVRNRRGSRRDISMRHFETVAAAANPFRLPVYTLIARNGKFVQHYERKYAAGSALKVATAFEKA